MIKQAPFKPTDIGGCKAWFDSFDASYTTTGNTVTAWTNKSGNANATTGSGTVSINQRTLNGKSSVRFAAGTNYLNIGSITYSTSYRNQFFVVTVAVSGSFYFYLNCNDTICGQCYSWNDSDIEINRFGTLGLRTYPTGYFNSTSIVSICTSSGGNTGIFVNGVSQTLADNNVGTGGFWSTGTATSITLGGQNGFTTGNLDMYELLQYDGDLTRAQRLQIESYLAQKWGLRQQLPQGHPGTRGIVYPSQPIPTAIYWRYPSPFNPTSIGGCQIWLDAADSATFTLNGSTVSTWMDKTGNGFNVSQATAGSQPTLGSNEVVFNGSTSLQYSGSVGIFGKSYTSYVIHTPTNNTSYQQGVISIKDSTTGFDFEIGQFYVWVSGGSIYQQFTASVNSKTILGITSTTSLGLNYSINGQPFTAGGAGWFSVSAGSLLLIGNSQYSATGFIGTINEYLLFTRTLTATEHNQITGYLAWKWGSQSSLPSNHPFKNAAPIGVTNPAGISRPANVLPIPPITLYASTRIPAIMSTALSYLPLATNSTDIGTSPQTITTNGTISYVTFAGKQTAYFTNNPNNYLSFPYVNQTNFTLSYWINPADTGYYTSVSITTSGLNPALQSDLTGSSASITIYTAMPNQWANQPTGTINAVGAWTHIAVTINQTTFVEQLYINGSLASTVTGSGTGISSRNLFFIGRSGDTGPRSATGYVRQFCFFPTVLTQAQVQTVQSYTA
jgi:hypothetical protein